MILSLAEQSAAARTVGTHTTTPAVYVISRDEYLRETLLRLCAVAGLTAQTCTDPVAVDTAWRSTCAILLGADMLHTTLPAAGIRRAGVMVVTTDSESLPLWERALDIGAEQVRALPAQEQQVLGWLLAWSERQAGQAKTVAVIGGHGGAGATTLAISLAVTGCEYGNQTVLVDADPLGGGIDMALGGEQAAGLRWPELAETRGHLSSEELRRGLPTMEELMVLSWDRGDVDAVSVEAMQSVLAAAKRGSDLVVIDLPRVRDRAGQAALAAADAVIVICGTGVRSVAATSRVVRQLRQVGHQPCLAVRGGKPKGLGVTEIRLHLGVPLAGTITTDPHVHAALERGESPVGVGRAANSLSRFCRGYLDSLFGRGLAGEVG